MVVTKVGTGLRLHRQDKNGDDNKNREQKKKPSHIVLLRAQTSRDGVRTTLGIHQRDRSLSSYYAAPVEPTTYLVA
jgi:hypothetical protein